jgi:ATP-dependent helicase HrpA
MEGRYGITLTEALVAGVPSHLVPIVEVYSDSDALLGRGTDVIALRNSVREDAASRPSDERIFSDVRVQYEQREVVWSRVPDLPDSVKVGSVGPVPIYAYPYFRIEGSTVAVIVATERISLGYTLDDVLRCIAWNELRSSFRAVEKTIQADKPLCQQISTFTSLAEFFGSLEDHVRQYALAALPEEGSNQSRVSVAVEKGALRIKEMGADLRKLIGAIVLQRNELQRNRMMTPAIRSALDEIAGGSMLRLYPYELLAQVPRYLRALKIRMERAYADPRKDAEKQSLTATYAAMLYGAERPPVDLLMLFREFQIAVFAPEVKTTMPVSEKRMKEAFGQYPPPRTAKQA